MPAMAATPSAPASFTTRDRLLAAAWSLGALAYYLPLKLHQWFAFDAHGELADFEAILWNTAHGRWLQQGGEGLSFLHQHASPVLLLLAPVYAAAPHPATLLVLQAVLAAAAAAPLWLLAVHLLEDRRAAHLATLAFVVSRQINYGVMYDFHMEVLYPVLYFGLFLAVARGRGRWFVALLLLTMTVKEDAMVANLGLAAWLATGGRPRWALAAAGLSLAGLALAFGVVMPAARPPGAGGEYRFLDYWSDYGRTPGGVLRGMLDPRMQVRVLLTGAKLGKMFNLFAAALFLPLAHWRTALFLAVPAASMLFSTNRPVVWGVGIYYGFLIMPLLWAGALANLRRLRARGPRAARASLALAVLLAVVNVANSRLAVQLRPDYWRVDPRWETARELIARIPAEAPVAAQVDLVSHVPVRQERWTLPWGAGRVDWLLFDLEGNAWPRSVDENRAHAAELAASPAWAVRGEGDGFLLLEKVDAVAPETPPAPGP